ncbi:MAG TPA: glutathione S-transferase [Acidimicrobiales bacterium]|nr:glutathione S-transferase [Acidimicrobiales bacterium]
MSQATLTINSKNYGAWSLRSWLSCRMAGLDFVEVHQSADDPGVRAELLLLSPSFLVPKLEHDGVQIWDTLAIGEYLGELIPGAGLLPEEKVARARCRSICGEMHSGFAHLRSALPMNIKGRHEGFKIWSGAQVDIDRIVTIWRDCLDDYGGPYLFGSKTTVADAMYAPVCTRFVTYDVGLDPRCAAYRDSVLELPEMVEWIAAAHEEPDELDELDMEF